MAFEYKDKDTLVNDVVQSIIEDLDFDIDISDGEPLRTIIEAIMQEVELQYWQLQDIRDNSFIDSAYGDELTELVKILGIERLPAEKAEGQVKFYRETPADLDYLIPVGTLVETLPDLEGNSIRYETLENVVLATGEMEVTANIIAVEAGKSGNVAPNKVVIINDPPLGVESVTNVESIIGGEEEEEDEDLVERAKTVLDTKGNATIGALKNKVSELDGVRDVSVLDMERGIGTADVFVLGDIVPLSQTKRDEIIAIIESTKASGIDIQLQEPTVINVDIIAELTLKSGYTLETLLPSIQSSVENYVNNLTIGETLIKNQLERFILNTSEGILDINLSSPIENVVPNTREIIRLNTTTIS